LKLAYQIQDAAIDLWPEPIGGWKVGRIPAALEKGLGIDRLAGPIFANTIASADSGTVLDMPMYVGGFAAIEAEFVAVIKRDAPAGKLTWSLDEALAMIGDLRIGLEIASSPLATINELGPTVVVSDFGNNSGLIVGPSIDDWLSRSLDSMRCSSSVDDEEVGAGGAFNLTGGFVRSVQFLLELMARRKRPLRAGAVIATGQTTGIHDITVGQVGRADFAGDGNLGVRLTAAEAIA
jgi:2-keto-4-pentenoate hydratase